jgi:hypothetical protein
MPSVTSDLFGPVHLAPIYTLLNLAPCIGSYVFSSAIAGPLYDAEPQVVPPAALSLSACCKGISCYRTTFEIIAACMAFSVVIAIVLVQRTRHRYAQI